jgi:hypothetical protein
LDGAWLSSNPETGGLRGVLERLKEDQTLRSDILRDWREIRLFDPHHPFLLDELQRWISFFSRRIAGVPPLIEVHQDGQLFILVPGSCYDEIVKLAIDKLGNRLPFFKLELNVSNRGVPALYNGQPTHTELMEFIANQLTPRDLGDLFKIKSTLKEQVGNPLGEILSGIGLEPRWPKRTTGALVSLYANLDDLRDVSRECLCRAAHLVLLLNIKIDASPSRGILSYRERENILLEALSKARPHWINEVEDRDSASRRTLTALWVTALADNNAEILERVWGHEGLLQQWLEGKEDQPGFNKFITGQGALVQAEVKRRLSQILSGQRVVAEDETDGGRCIFTDEPVPFDRTIDQATGLYGLKVSAFSGREGRPELLTSELAHTNVSGVSTAEHKLRSLVHELQGGRDNGVPTLISSPTTSGLFGGLGMTDDRAMGAMSVYDLNRLEVKKGRVLNGVQTYQGRYRMARLERVPEDLQGQVNLMRMLLQAARRIGRPLHLFRGLPMPQQAYFYYDAMPKVLVNLLGGNALRLEQLPEALGRLEMVQKLLEAPGLGYDVVRLFTTPSTRFAAICWAWCHLRDREEQGSETVRSLYGAYLNYVEEKKIMSEQDGALVRLGQAAAGIQQKPLATASASEELLVFNLCFAAANETRRNRQEDPTSLIYAVAGELETNLVRKEKAAARKWRGDKGLMEGCLNLAELFVNQVWFGVLGGRAPSQKSRRILSSIYRMAFLQTHRQRAETK